MKKLISILTIMGFVLAFGTAYAASGYGLDPSKVPGWVDPETGSATLPAPEALFVPRGSAAGGMSTEPDTFLNYIDPSNVPGYVDLETGSAITRPAGFREFKEKGSAAGGMSTKPDILLNYIDPSRAPGYADLETGMGN